MTIPIRNLYYLFCYAWARFPQGDAVEAGVDDCPDPPNLFARLLINGANRLIRRGLDRGYCELTEETRSPRGRLLLDRMVKEQTLLRGAAVCSYDELTVDVRHNQILKATAAALARTSQLTRAHAHELRLIVGRLGLVSDIRLTSGAFRQVQLSRNTGQYVPLLKLCELIFRSLLPEQGGSGTRFADILKDDVTMSAIFEEFLRNFYAHEQRVFRVGRERMSWLAEGHSQGDLSYLPAMETDITLRSPERIVVMDAKYYRETFERRHGVPKIHSAHLYQLFAYLRHAGRGKPPAVVEGVLVYPAVGAPASLRYSIHGHPIRVVAVDLARPWQDIHDELLSLLPAAAA